MQESWPESEKRWSQLVEVAGWSAGLAEHCFDELAKHYSGENRHYHNLIHIRNCLDWLDQIDTKESLEIEIALWFHDVIYDPTRSDNEAVSAEFAANWLEKMGTTSETIERLIIATDHKTIPQSFAEKTIVDIDLSILGSDPDAYEIYARQVRREYHFVAENNYKAGRTAVLNHFLNRDFIYHTDWFRDRLETRARENLAAEIERLN